ncbi:MAG TPA: trypsin-like peptidase domain-containing protein, partial [Candidatus Limnocylindria bacterium]|nr:trypsin-like peptidase domain-containing protein [Candidatus Limnocylindria bacterium]
MSDAPIWSPPPPPPAPPRAPNVAGIAILALLVGAIGGAATGGYVATTRLASSPEQPTAVATSTTAPGPIPSAPPVIASTTNDVVGVVNELLPSVVTVINRLPNGIAQSSGSGFVIDATRGYLVTNNHVVENVRDTNAGAWFDVIFSDNRVVKDAKLIGRDDKTDVAVLQVPPQGLKAAALANSDDVPVGSTVVAIGSALGELQNTVTSGIVSAKGRR